MTYTTSQDVLVDRIQWAIAALTQLAFEGRSEGWIPGDPARVARSPDDLRTQIEDRAGITPNNVLVVPLEWVRIRLGLDQEELEALWLLACCEIDPTASRLAQAFATPDCPDLSIQILQRITPLTAAQLGQLAQLGLIETTTDVRLPMHRRWVRASDRIVELARGELRLDAALADSCTLEPPTARGEAPSELVRAMLAQPAPWVIAIGPRDAGRSTLLRSVAAAHGKGTLRVRAAELGRDELLARQLRAVAREACLFDVYPVFEGLEREQAGSIERALRGCHGPILATMTESPAPGARPIVMQELTLPPASVREVIWREQLPTAAESVLGVASQYALRPGAIVAASTSALAQAGEGKFVLEAHIHDGVRAHVGQQLGSLATRIDWRQTWDDLVLPVDQFDQVVELVSRVRHRRQVLETWGFGPKIGKGHGVAALFSGPPGTGKTMVAGLVASELKLDLYQVDLSKVVSKFIGETEKNLASLFDAAESGHAILLFDEADALFAKRSEVKSSNDRYANLEVNYLLQRMESFTGISLLTTNHETSIDDAFRRRIALHVRFPMPEEDQRRDLWRAMLPAQAAVDQRVDFERLASEFAMSGGYIKNAVVRAAYLAADDGTSIGMAHFWKAARAEYEGMGKVAFQRAS